MTMLFLPAPKKKEEKGIGAAKSLTNQVPQVVKGAREGRNWKRKGKPEEKGESDLL